MLFAGIDIGSLTAEAVVARNGDLLGAEIMGVLPHPVESAREVMGRVLWRLAAPPSLCSLCLCGFTSFPPPGLALEHLLGYRCLSCISLDYHLFFGGRGPQSHGHLL